MAQSGFTPILMYSSSTASQAPSASNLTNSTLGSELAINITDGKLFYKDNTNTVQVIGWKTVPTGAGGTGLTSYTTGDLLYYASGSALSKLAIGSNTAVLTSTGTAPQWTAQSSLSVGTATNIAGGAAGSVPYQSAANTTAMLAIGAAGRWLGSSGTAPQWNAPAALTKTDDTNVTLTLGGSASTALLNAASLTLGWTGTLAVTRGGTGLSTVAQGDILYGSASNTLAALAKNTTATRYLSNTGTSNNPAWAQVDLSNGVTGGLGVANGGTGLTTGGSAGEIIYSGAGTAAFGYTSNLAFSSGKLLVNGSSFSTADTYVQANANGGNSAKAFMAVMANGSNIANQVCGMYFARTNNYIQSTVDGNGAFRDNIVVTAGNSGGVQLTSGSTAWASLSDFRKKIIIEPIENALESINSWRTVIGRYKADDEARRRLFLIAQDVQATNPEAVAIQDEGMTTEELLLMYTDTIPVLVAAIKEMQQKLKAAGVAGF